MVPPPKTIDNLPEELLIHIGSQITHLNRNSDLISLALVSKRWRPIAQEWLIKVPRFSLAYLDHYMWELGHRPWLLRQVKSLEIWSNSDAWVKRDEHGLSIKEYPQIGSSGSLLEQEEFMRQSINVIRQFAANECQMEEWLFALDRDVVSALFGVLLCALPNLTELRLGEGWLMQFPIFSTMLSLEADASYPRPSHWKQTCLAGALATILPRLQVLDVPAEMTAMCFTYRATLLFDFRRFEKLKVLGITMKALHIFGRAYLVPPNPRAIFPKTLEVLRISEATHCTADFLKELCVAKKAAFFPSLRRVEVFFFQHMESTVRRARANHCTDAIEDLPSMFKDARLQLYLYFPSWRLTTWDADGTPWRLRREKNAIRLGEWKTFRKGMGAFGVFEKTFPVFEAEWDEDGDVVMR